MCRMAPRGTSAPRQAEPALGLRERTRRAVRAEIADAALRLFVERGFDETTVDDVVAVVGVSRRSFFRYFGSKEDVVLGFLDDVGVAICAGLAARPVDEPPWIALRRSLTEISTAYGADADRILALHRLIYETSSLRARHLDKQDRWHRLLTAELAARLEVDPAKDLAPRVLAAAAVAALDVAIGAWAETQGSASMPELLDSAFGALSNATSAGLDQSAASSS